MVVSVARAAFVGGAEDCEVVSVRVTAVAVDDASAVGAVGVGVVAVVAGAVVGVPAVEDCLALGDCSGEATAGSAADDGVTVEDELEGVPDSVEVVAVEVDRSFGSTGRSEGPAGVAAVVVVSVDADVETNASGVEDSDAIGVAVAAEDTDGVAAPDDVVDGSDAGAVTSEASGRAIGVDPDAGSDIVGVGVTAASFVTFTESGRSVALSPASDAVSCEQATVTRRSSDTDTDSPDPLIETLVGTAQLAPTVIDRVSPLASGNEAESLSVLTVIESRSVAKRFVNSTSMLPFPAAARRTLRYALSSSATATETPRSPTAELNAPVPTTIASAKKTAATSRSPFRRPEDRAVVRRRERVMTGRFREERRSSRASFGGCRIDGRSTRPTAP